MNIFQCLFCKKDFKVYGKRIGKYCSQNCMAIDYKTKLHGEDNPNYRHGLPYCELCGIELSKNAQKWCLKCKGIEQRGSKNPFAGQKHTTTTRMILSQKRKGKNYWLGKHHTDKTKTKLKIINQNRWINASEDYRNNRISALLQCTKDQRNYKETKPERIVRLLLEKHQIKFTQNAPLYGKFLVDFLLSDNRIIEVFGDYWHGNPNVFKSFNETQQKQINRDKSRIAYLEKCGHKVLILWERDIIEKNEYFLASIMP